MDIQLIREQIGNATSLVVSAITVILKAIVGIVLQFVIAKKLILQQVDCFTKKTNLRNPVVCREFYA